MGKIVKTVLKIAVVAAIAYFAPPLAGKLAGAIGLKGAVGTTLLSGALGAGAGQLGGVGWKTGLLIGGFAGAGNTGLFGGKAAAKTAVAGTGPPAAGVAPLGNTTLSGITGASAGNTALASLANAPIGVGLPATVGPAGFGSALSGAAGAAAGAGAGAAAVGPTTLGQALGGLKSNPASFIGGGVKNLTAGVGGALGTVGLAGAGSGVAGGTNFAAFAPALLAANLAGNPGAAMAKAQEAELLRAQQVNAALTQQRLDQANQLYGEANYFDPEYMARQAQEAAMIKGGIQTAEQTRGLTGERLAAERRRMRLGTARSAGSAYQQGYGTGVGARIQTRQAGLAAMPTEYPLANPTGAIATSENAAKRRAGEEAGLSALFSQALGRRPTLAQMTPDAAYAISQNPDLF